MKFFLSLAFVFLSFVSVAQPQKFKLRLLHSYYLDENIPLKKGLNFMVLSDEKTFIKYFGDLDIEGKPNFDFEHVLVLAMLPTKKQYFLSFEDYAMKAGNFIEIYFNEEKKKHELTYLDHPIVVAAIPKYFSVTKINFYNKENNKLEETVRVR